MMQDFLSQGKDGGPSPWPPRLVVIVILVLLVVAVVRHLPDERVTSPNRPASAVSAGPVQLAGLGRGAAGLLDQADGIVQPTLAQHLPYSDGCHRRAARLGPAALSPCGPNRPRPP